MLHIIDRLDVGGAERVCVDLANICCEHGLSIGILVLLDESKLDAVVSDKISLCYLHRKSKLQIKKYLEAASLCRSYDILHVHMRHVYRYISVVKLLGLLKVKIIFHDHFGGIRTDKRIPFLFRSLFKPEFYVGVSEELVNWAVESLRITRRHAFLLSNIIRRVISLEDQSRKASLVIVSNIRRTKNIGFAIQVAQELNMQLDIIGQVIDTEYYDELKSYLATTDAANKVRFIHDCFDIQPCLGRYRMAIHTATSETGPLVLMEYLAQGFTFLAYRTGEVAESLYHKLPEFFIETFELDSWKGRIIALMERTIEKKALQQIFATNFDESDYYERCSKIYQIVLAS